MTQVLAKALDQDRHQFDLADDRVAAPAQEATHTTGVVAVVNDKITFGRVAQQAAPPLDGAHLLNLGRREPVLPHQTRTEVFGPRRFGISPAPLSQALIPAVPVRLAVLTIPATHAGATLAPFQAPVGEVRVRQGQLTDTTRGHGVTMPCDTNMQALDQPCHADVLLEVANA